MWSMIAFHDVEELAPPRRLEIGDGAFEQVPGIVHLVVVAQVGPAVFRLALDVPAVEIAVGKLRLFEVVDDGVDLCLDLGIAAVMKGIARRLDPFADIGIPEDLGREAMLVARDRQLRHRLGQLQRFEHVVGFELAVLARHRMRQNRIKPLPPEGAGQPDVCEVDRRVFTHDVFPRRTSAVPATGRVVGRRSLPSRHVERRKSVEAPESHRRRRPSDEASV